VPARQSSSRDLTLAFLASLLAVSQTPLALAQPAGALTLQDATILVGDGTRIDRGSVLVRGERIAAVGDDHRASRGTTISAEGKFITPGLIDVWSTLAAEMGGRSERWDGRAADAFDRYDEPAIRDALAQGVTTVFTPARSGDGIGGLGAVIRLVAGGEPEQIVLKDKGVLCAVLGSDPRQGAVARLRAARDLRRLFSEAQEYRQAFEDYEEELKEYEKKLGERGKQDKTEPKEDDESAYEEVESGSVEDGAPPDDPAEPPPRPRRPARRQPQAGPARAPAGEEEPKKEGFKKPVEPEKDRNKELLLEALDGKFVLRVEAHRPADVLNALELAEKYNLALVLEGASGAAPIAKRLAEKSVPVIVPVAPPLLAFTPGPLRYQEVDAAARLARAGVRVYLGSGPAQGARSATRHLALGAALAVAGGLDADAALRMITTDAAKLLGVEEQVGSVARGKSADLVVWSDHPFAPGAKVERVFIAGREVYRAAGVAEGGE